MSAVDPATAACGFHDTECAGYLADIPLWIALADTCGGRMLDLGAGTGRVSLPVASTGHEVIAVDLEPALLEELERRAAEHDIPIRTAAADIRRLADELPSELHGADLIAIPMQTIQLLGGPAGRRSCLVGCAQVASPGAELVISIVQEVEPFDGRDASPLLLPPDVAEIGGLQFESTPLAVLQDPAGGPIDMHRRRIVRAPDGSVLSGPDDIVITLDPLTAAQLQLEATEAGWTAAEVIELPETDEHAGSTILAFRLEERA